MIDYLLEIPPNKDFKHQSLRHQLFLEFKKIILTSIHTKKLVGMILQVLYW